MDKQTHLPPLILITNDDGIASPGLRAAAEALDGLGEVLVAAPHQQQSGMGRSMPKVFEGRILPQPMALDGHQVQAYAVEGAPAEVVQHTMLELVPRQPALLVAGINYGENIGAGLVISGTIGAALEGASFGVPALAVSLQTDPEHYKSYSQDVDFGVAAHFLKHFARKVLAEGLPSGVDVLKVDVPCAATRQTAWRWTRASRQRYFVPVKAQRASLAEPGKIGFVIRVDPAALEPDSDIYALVVDKVVSVTPLTEDMTASAFETLWAT